MGAVYLFGRVLYTLGYTTGDPSARNTRGGIIAALAYYRKFFLFRGSNVTPSLILTFHGWDVCVALALVATYYAVKPLIA